MPDKKNKEKVLQIRMEEDMYDTLKLFAESYGMTISKYCYRVLDYWIMDVIDQKGNTLNEDEPVDYLHNMVN